MDFLISSLQFGQEAAQELVDQITSEFLEIGGGTVTFNVDYSYLMSRSDLEESGTWNLEGNKLYLNISDETVDEDPLTIESMNSSAAVVAWEQEQEIDLGEGTSKFGLNSRNASVNILLAFPVRKRREYSFSSLTTYSRHN